MEITWLLSPILLRNGPRTEELKRRPGSFKNVILILHTQYWPGFEQPAESMLFWFSMSFALRHKPVKRRRPHKKASSRSPAFDVKLFLDSAGLGRKVEKFPGKETVFAQGDPAKNVMSIQQRVSKLTLFNKTAND